MLKPCRKILYAVGVTCVVATASRLPANETGDGWRTKSQPLSKKENMCQPAEETLLLVPGHTNQVTAETTAIGEPFDWMDDVYGPSGTPAERPPLVVSNEFVMEAAAAQPPSITQSQSTSYSHGHQNWCSCEQRTVCKQCGLHLPSLALYPTDSKNSAGGYFNLVETNSQKVLDSIRVGMSQVNDQLQSTLGRF
jgi:hypothetical protein